MYTFIELPQLHTAHTASLQEMKIFEAIYYLKGMNFKGPLF